MAQDKDAKDVKLDRKSLKSPDAFVRKGREWLALLMGQKTRWLPLGLTVLAVAVAVYGYDAWSNRRLEKAWSAYYQATKQAEPARWEALKKVATDWKGTRAAYFAAVTVADHFFDEARRMTLKPADALKDPKEKDAKTPPTPVDPVAAAVTSAEWYTTALGYADLTSSEKPLVLLNRGEAYEIQNKLDEALADYQKAADLGGDSKALAMLQVGRAFELKKDTAKAIETYDKIANEFRPSEFGRLAKNAVRRLKSPLFTASLEAETKS